MYAFLYFKMLNENFLDTVTYIKTDNISSIFEPLGKIESKTE